MSGGSRPFSSRKPQGWVRLFIAAAALVLVVPTAVFADTTAPAASTLAGFAAARAGEVLVEFAPGTESQAMSLAGRVAGAALQRAHAGRSDHSKPFALFKSSGLTTAELLRRFENVTGVVAVSPNYVQRLAVETLVPPNDPRFGDQWALENTGQAGGFVDADIDALTAWQITTGSPDAVVAVIDSGVEYNHPDLAGNMWTNPGEIPGDGLDNDGNGKVDDVYGIDAVNSDSDPLDDNGHGTHVAGIIGAVGNNGVGVTGVAWEAQIMALKAFDRYGYGTDAEVMECIDYAIEMKVNHGVNVVAINASYEGDAYSSVVERKIQEAGDAGIIFCAAAGNSKRNTDVARCYPASYNCSNIIAVGASDTDDTRASWSNYGAATVDLFAPGVNIWSTYLPSTYRAAVGTSMAAPQVAGTVALLAAVAPADSVSARRNRILSTVDKPGDLSGLCVTGGRLNAGAAVSNCTTVFQQNDSRLTYLGCWMGAYQWQASGGSFRWADSRGAAVMVNFTGTSVALLAKTALDRGKALVSLDGGVAEAVDFYSAASLYQQRVYEKVGLDNVAHTLTIEWAGVKNVSSAGYLINVDALEILGNLTQAPLPSGHQQDEPEVTYSGSWSKSSTWAASGGSFAYANSSGAALNVKFTGTYLAWYAKTAYNYGKARVSLDGGPLLDVDLYSATSQYKRCVYNTGKLEEGEHTLSIYWSGLKNAASGGYLIDADAFYMLGDLLSAPAAEPIPTLYQQGDTRLTHLGSWGYAAQAPASGGSFNYTVSPGAALNVSFTGTSVALLGKTASNYGQALVSLDGGAAELVDFYSPTALYQQRVYAKDGLGDAAHTLSIEYSGDKNVSSAGYLVNVDALEIMGSLTEAPKPTRHQQDEADVAYSGAWSKAWTWSASGGSLRYTNSPGAGVTVQFEGTYLAWVAKTAPWYGKATVTLDHGTPVTVDLYSAGSLYKRSVYNTGKLSDGEHTLTIEWSGLKNAASSGYQISVDAFDLLGVLEPITL